MKYWPLLVSLTVVSVIFFVISNALATDQLIFQDDFNNLAAGSNAAGQNNWVSTGVGGNWQIVAGSNGNYLRESTGGNYAVTPLSQTVLPLGEARVKVDFQATANGSPQIWLRRSTTSSSASGYVFLYYNNAWYFDYFPGAKVLSSVAATVTVGSWYTAEFETLTDTAGNPVLKAWVYPQGTARPATATLSYTHTATNKLSLAGYVALASYLSPVSYDNVFIYSADTVAPIMSSISAGTPSITSATITWTTNELATSKVEYGFSTDYTDSVVLPISYTTAHTAPLVDLLGSSTYHYHVISTDPSGNTTISPDQTFLTATGPSDLIITFPRRDITSTPNTATLAIPRSECNVTFYIPYIQASSTLSVAATPTVALPSGGGVKFKLLDTHGNQYTQDDMAAPFETTFTNVNKGEYTLDVYNVDASGTIINTPTNHDQATHIGIGDVYVAIGDSVTEGYYGQAFSAPPYQNWIIAPVKSLDNRNYPQCGNTQILWQKVSHHINLNNVVSSYNDYPVFFLNQGVGGINSASYITRMTTTAWKNSVNAIQPNKWLLHLGINDGGGSAAYQTRMQTIITTLKTTYGADPKNIILAVPSAQANWQPYINNLISANGLTRGPDFNTFYLKHINPPLVVGIHPNVAGHVEMGRLWGISLLKPKNVTIEPGQGGSVTLTWSSLSPYESSIAGYKIKYGTSPGNYSSINDVGNVTNATIQGLTPGQQYYFVISGYDNDLYVKNETDDSIEVSITL